MAKKKRRRGHYCVGCGQVKANEKFSGSGHRLHICKDCKRERRKERKRQQNTDQTKDEFFVGEEFYEYYLWMDEQDEQFQPLIAPLPFLEDGVGNVLKMEQTTITFTTEMGDMLREMTNQQQLDKALRTASAMLLYSNNMVTLEKGAGLAEMSFTDFIHLLDAQGISWNTQTIDGSDEYRKSLATLLKIIDLEKIEEEEWQDDR